MADAKLLVPLPATLLADRLWVSVVGLNEIHSWPGRPANACADHAQKQHQDAQLTACLDQFDRACRMSCFDTLCVVHDLFEAVDRLTRKGIEFALIKGKSE